MSGQRVVVLGGSGGMGSRLVQRLAARGVDVVPASRDTGVDVLSRRGLDEALAGADTVVDCLNVAAMSRRTAVTFFERAAFNVTQSVQNNRVPNVVVISIVQATAVAGALGYYAGKVAQERIYYDQASPRMRVTMVRSTQWFSLVRQLADQFGVGPITIVPGLRIKPVHDAAVVELLADAATTRQEGARSLAELAGPQILSMPQLVSEYLHAQGISRRVVATPMGPLADGLLPDDDCPTDPRRFADWLTRTPKSPSAAHRTGAA